ncbi:aldehyde dehydrogenase [Paenibacillus validus]|uniref:Aldehyde dehydrogenase family protein n=1 Tax=Paenibacillus validus TaxID=44253 RepID=A0A7X2ZDG8_9BACL|nr:MULTISPECIES: aldehyde dehydrogenase [Paenibacillus]MED4601381.1 aldehyde dehydrogenase [Paenibacillus validus]MED4605074.1 aldehyde dehydrogenase [Paenibacillus validus]MUG72929.1 aldehyde dehydrogenase family protein [Paenibacillus validus]
MAAHYQMLIKGRWVDSSTKERFPSINPFNQEVWSEIPQASEEDVNEAIEAARTTFDTSWKHVNGLERARLLMKFADLLDEDAERMAALETTDNGKVIRETTNQMHFAARNYRFFAGYADKLYGEVIPLDNPMMFDYTLREAVGVVVLITSWNSPIAILANKLAPALAAGNTVVIKPSEHTSATTLELGKLIQKAGFPDGVVNIVTGDGRVGNYLTQHPGVNKISFTGGTETGKLISRNASQNLIPVTLELGGKSPNIIFDDADIHAAVIGAVAGIYGASGQTCIAGSRLLVQHSVYDEVIQKIVDKAKTIRLGNPIDPLTEMGPAANKPQYDRILGMISKGKDEGAKLVYGGHAVTDHELKNGYFIAPAIFIDVDNKSTIAQEEIFGPVLSVIPFTDQDEAVQIANDSKYGLASGIWTSNVKRVHRLARQIQAGTVWVNTYRTSAAQAPFGGVKLSGHGRERGWHALLEYTQIKNIMLNLSDDTRDPFSIQM